MAELSIPPVRYRCRTAAAQTFTTTPQSGYNIADVKVDGSSAGAISSYTFVNVVANHTIDASFEVNLPHNISVSWNPPGQATIVPSGTVNVPYRTNQSFTITETKKKGISKIVVDGNDTGIQPDSPYVYTFYNVIADHSLFVQFS